MDGQHSNKGDSTNQLLYEAKPNRRNRAKYFLSNKRNKRRLQRHTISEGNMEDEVKTRNTDKKRIEALEERLDAMTQYLESLTGAVIHTFHVVGAPHDILIKNGLKPYKKDA